MTGVGRASDAASFRVHDELYGQNARIMVTGLEPLGRLAGNYTKFQTFFTLPSEDS